MKNLIFIIVVLLIAPFSFSQVPQVAGPFSPFPPPHNPYLPSPYPATTAVAGTASGASVTASGSVEVATKVGLKVPVPVSVAADIGKGRIAAAALGCTNVVGAVVCAATAAATLKELKDAGLGYGPCPVGSMYTNAFICKPDPNYNVNQVDPASTGWKNQNGQYIGDLNSYSQSLYAQYSCNSGSGHINLTSSTTATVTCVNQYGAVGLASLTRETPYEPNVPMIVPSESEMEADLQTRMNQDYDANRRLVDAMRQDQDRANQTGQKMPLGFNPIDADTPVSVNAPPVTSPKQTISEKQIPQPDGSVNNEKKESQTTITPTTTGTTAGNVKTEYKTSTVITTTVTNNVTNNSTVTNETVNDTAEPSKGLCDLYPDIFACAKMGDAPEKEQIPTQEIPVTYSPVSFTSSAGCPSPVTFEMYGARSISWQPFCDTMGNVRPIFLACAAVACALIFLKGMSSS